MAQAKKMDQAKVEQAITLYKTGIPVSELAEYYDVSRQWIYALLNKHGAIEDKNVWSEFLTEEEWKNRKPDYAQRANGLVASAIKRGVLKPQPCEVCGSQMLLANGQRGVQAHHDDYNKPLEVRWLCKKHHDQWHMENKPVYVAG